MPPNYTFYTHLNYMDKDMRIKSEKYPPLLFKGENCSLFYSGAPRGVRRPFSVAYKVNLKEI